MSQNLSFLISKMEMMMMIMIAREITVGIFTWYLAHNKHLTNVPLYYYKGEDISHVQFADIKKLHEVKM